MNNKKVEVLPLFFYQLKIRDGQSGDVWVIKRGAALGYAKPHLANNRVCLMDCVAAYPESCAEPKTCLLD